MDRHSEGLGSISPRRNCTKTVLHHFLPWLERHTESNKALLHLWREKFLMMGEGLAECECFRGALEPVYRDIDLSAPRAITQNIPQ